MKALEHVAALDHVIVWVEKATYDDTTAEQCAGMTAAYMLLLQARGYIVRAAPCAPAPAPARAETPPMLGVPAPFGCKGGR